MNTYIFILMDYVIITIGTMAFKEDYKMVLAIIFLLVASVCIFGTLRSIKNRNFLAVFFAGATTLLFGWFSIMTLISEISSKVS